MIHRPVQALFDGSPAALLLGEGTCLYAGQQPRLRLLLCLSTSRQAMSSTQAPGA